MTLSVPRKRYYTLDIAKAIAIILVAVGHFDVDPMPAFYAGLRSVIYTFHMPLFMLASGFLCAATWKEMPYVKFISKKFKRLMIPYFATSVIVICIKLCTERFLPVDNPVTLKDFIEILWLPKAGYFLWFVYALWWMMVIYPMFNTPMRRKIFFLATAVLFYFNDVFPDIFCLKETARMAVYFSAGTLFVDFPRKMSVKDISLYSLIIFPVLTFLFLEGYLTFDAKPLVMLVSLVLAFSGIAFIIVISNWIDVNVRGKNRQIILSIAACSYIIYLFHTTFMGFSKAILVKIGFFNTAHLFINYSLAELIVPLFSGVFIPFVFTKYVLARFELTRKLFGIPQNVN